MISHFRLARNRELTLGDDGAHSTESSVSFDSNDLHRDLAGAMLKLSPQERMALHLHLHKQLTHQEICTIMDIPLGTVKTAITRGKKKLQESLVGWETGGMS